MRLAVSSMLSTMSEETNHPLPCPNCGKLTRNWLRLSVRVWFECEHCHFSGKASTTPVAVGGSR